MISEILNFGTQILVMNRLSLYKEKSLKNEPFLSQSIHLRNPLLLKHQKSLNKTYLPPRLNLHGEFETMDLDLNFYHTLFGKILKILKLNGN